MGRTTRTAALLGAALAALGAVLVGCAQPGQLGRSDATAAPAPGVAAAPEQEPELPMLLGSGLVQRPVGITTPGPAVHSVRTVIIPPGVDVGWHRHPGTETTIVTAGEVTLQIEDDCDPVRYTAGEALFVPDAQPHVMRNEGDVTAELVVTYLLAPGAPDQLSAPDACAGD